MAVSSQYSVWPPKETMSELRKLTVLGRFGYSCIPVITQFVADAARDANLDEDAVFHCQMSVDEACTNVIEHAYGEDPGGNFEVSCGIEPGKCVIEIVDQGKPFDPLSVPPPKASQSLDDIRPGGVGIHLMRQLMDSIQFEYTNRGNTLTMVKTSPQLISASSADSIPIREDESGVWIIEPNGPIDSLTAPKLDEAISQSIASGHVRIVVDLAEVTYISSKGLKAIVSGWRQSRDRGGDLVLCAVVPRVHNIIDTIGFNQLFSIYLTLDEAKQAVLQGRPGSDDHRASPRSG